MQSDLFSESPRQAHARRLRALADAGRKDSPASKALRAHATQIEPRLSEAVKKTPPKI